MTTPFLAVPIFRAFDAAGLPLAGGLLYCYAAGTTTPKDTYSDYQGSHINSNPVQLDTTGSATVRLGEGGYNFILKDSTGTTTYWSADHCQQLNDGDDLTLGSLNISGTNVPANGIGSPSANVVVLYSNSTALLKLVSNQVQLYETLNALNTLKNAATYEVGTFTGTLTGCTTSPTATFSYCRSGNIVSVSCAAGLSATSNTTACTITGVPSVLSPVTAHKGGLCAVIDSGTTQLGRFQAISMASGGGVITFYVTAAANAFTGSGTKGLPTYVSFTYELT